MVGTQPLGATRDHTPSPIEDMQNGLTHDLSDLDVALSSLFTRMERVLGKKAKMCGEASADEAAEDYRSQMQIYLDSKRDHVRSLTRLVNEIQSRLEL